MILSAFKMTTLGQKRNLASCESPDGGLREWALCRRMNGTTLKAPSMFQFSSTAVNEVLRLKAKRKNANFLRLGVSFSGCMGMAYTIEFDQTAQSGDQVCDCGEIQVVTNAESLVYLSGLIVDYSEDLTGGGFRFQNPHSAQTCSCGNSFTVADQAPSR